MGGRRRFPIPVLFPHRRSRLSEHLAKHTKNGVQPSTKSPSCTPFLARSLALTRGGSDDGGIEAEREIRTPPHYGSERNNNITTQGVSDGWLARV